MRVQITVDIDAEYADPDHQMGVTEEGFERICDALESAVGAGNVDVAQADE